MCAIVILGIGVTGLTQGVTAALRSSKEAELQATAAWLAAGRIETLRAEGYLEDGTDEGDETGSFANFRWKQTVTRGDINGLHDVTVVIESAKSGKVIYELRTLLFDPPPSSTSVFGEPEKSKSSSSSSARKRDGRRR
jgi:type II secretory pathway pseudopilin PulG